MSKQLNATTTNSWVLFTWVSFIIIIIAMTLAVIYMPMDRWVKGYLALSSLFLIQSSISLSKTLRDQAETQSDLTE